MSPAGIFRWVAVSTVATLALAAGAPAQSQTRSNEVGGVTRPSQERKLSFSTQGVVAQAPVKEGDLIKTGEIILVQDDVIDKKELDRLELTANSTARVEAAEADLKVKQAVLKRKTDAGAGGFNEAEIEEATNDVTLREKQLQVAKEDQQEARIKMEQQAQKVKRLSLASPIDGIVEKLVVNVGEWADPQSRDGAAVVVTNDPLFLEVRELKSSQVAQLKVGQKVQVRYADDADKPENWQQAEVFYFAAVSDAQADTRLVKLRLSNPTGRPAGLWMVVKLPDNLANNNAQPANVAGR
ncbi:MAG: HlyD family efflux transporter periplasmic adaptor subunit [Anaerolineae bacterium]|nr:HlyD family efflux transporter periplasmic adaptor subunit [Phycisphaerae bacterium]